MQSLQKPQVLNTIDIEKNRIDYVSLCYSFKHAPNDAILDIFNTCKQNKMHATSRLTEIYGENPEAAEQAAKQKLEYEL